MIMNKYYFILATFICGMFASCTDSEEVDIAYQATININTDKVISQYRDYNDSEKMFHLDEDENLVLESYIYDEKGDLVSSEINEVSDYGKSISIKKTLSSGKYKILVLSIVSVTYENKKNYGWETSQTDKLSTFKLEQQYNNLWGVLGMGEIDFVIGDKPQTVTIDLRSKTSLLTIRYKNWAYSYASYRALSGETYDVNYHYQYNSDDILIRNNDQWKSSTTLSLGKVWYNELDVEKYLDFYIPYLSNKYEEFKKLSEIEQLIYIAQRNEYFYLACIPGDVKYNCVYKVLNTKTGSTSSERFAKEGQNQTVREGEQYSIDLDCINHTFEKGSSTRSLNKDEYRSRSVIKGFNPIRSTFISEKNW